MSKVDLKKNLNIYNPEFRSKVVELEERISSLDEKFKIKFSPLLFFLV